MTVGYGNDAIEERSGIHVARGRSHIEKLRSETEPINPVMIAAACANVIGLCRDGTSKCLEVQGIRR